MKKVLIAVTAVLLAGEFMKAYTQGTSPQDVFEASYAAEVKKDIPAAIKPLKEIEASESRNYILQLRLGWLSYQSGLYNESADYYRKAAQLEPLALEPLTGLVNALAAAQKNDDILKVYENILVIEPNNYTALSSLAWVAYGKKEYAKAAKMYSSLVQRYPSDVEMLLGLAYSVKLGGDSAEAAKYFKRALLISPKNQRALEGLK